MISPTKNTATTAPMSSAQRQREAAGDQRQQRLGNLIESVARLLGPPVQPPLDEAGQQVAGHGARADQGAHLPLKSHQWCRKRRGEKRDRSPADGLGRTEPGAPVREHRAAVERAVETRAQYCLREQRGTVGDGKQN